MDKGTKSLPYIDDSFKTYTAKLCLGKKTSSGDLTGEVIEEQEIPELYVEDVLEVFENFIGESTQVPPMTSAIHFEGKRLYDLARSGVEVERKERPIVIKSLKLLSFNGDSIEFEVICSRGTYVRVLGEDIAEALGTIGYLSSLRRTAVGSISVNAAVNIDELKENDLINPCVLISLKHIIVRDENIIKDIKDGKSIQLEEKDNTVLLCYYNENELVPLAVYQRNKDNGFKSLRGLW